MPHFSSKRRISSASEPLQSLFPEGVIASAQDHQRRLATIIQTQRREQPVSRIDDATGVVQFARHMNGTAEHYNSLGCRAGRSALVWILIFK